MTQGRRWGVISLPALSNTELGLKELVRVMHKLFVLHEGERQTKHFASIKRDSLATWAGSTSCAKAEELNPSQKIKTSLSDQPMYHMLVEISPERFPPRLCLNRVSYFLPFHDTLHYMAELWLLKFFIITLLLQYVTACKLHLRKDTFTCVSSPDLLDLTPTQQNMFYRQIRGVT